MGTKARAGRFVGRCNCCAYFWYFPSARIIREFVLTDRERRSSSLVHGSSQVDHAALSFPNVAWMGVSLNYSQTMGGGKGSTLQDKRPERQGREGRKELQGSENHDRLSVQSTSPGVRPPFPRFS